MRINFRLEYCVDSNKKLCLAYLHNNQKGELPLSTSDGQIWSGNFNIKPSDTFVYTYIVYENGLVIDREWGVYPHIIDGNGFLEYLALDTWTNIPKTLSLYSNAVKTFYGRQPQGKPAGRNLYPCTLILQVDIPNLKSTQKLLLCGNWRNWDIAQARPLNQKTPNRWEISINVKYLTFPFEFKFVIYDKSDNSYTWQENGNYVLPHIEGLGESSIAVLSGLQPDFPLTPVKAAGVILPLFSLKTHKSFGCGDFGDIKLLSDFCSKCGIRLIQILPINDTSSGGTWLDASPYSAISVSALHPIYLDLNQMPIAKDEQYLKQREEINAAPDFDYEKVAAAKREWAKKSFEINSAEVLTSHEFRTFFYDNLSWLMPYAAFCYLRDINGTPDFNSFGQYSKFCKSDIEALCTPASPAYKEISFYFYVQFFLHKQLLESSQYASSNGIAIKGDIAIGVSKYSADVWEHPGYFNTDVSAGAPPDIFSLDGQNWGFPTYNWEQIAKDRYTWWKTRLKTMAQYFGAYRIDHILGFFRIWQIPNESIGGLLGQFSPALALSKKDIESFGLEFKEEFVKPYINDKIVDMQFGEFADIAKENFLIKRDDGLYDVRLDFDTQRKVSNFFADKTDPQSEKIKKGLLYLLTLVLFVKDFKDKNLYHPRILFDANDYFKALDYDKQIAYRRLYNYFFYERNDDFWKKEALKKLPTLICSSPMLVCAEDLGMIPQCVGEVLKELQILSLEIERYPKKENEVFANVDNYPYLSVCSVSTPDTSTLREFLEEDFEKAERYYQNVLNITDTPPHSASPKICEQILARNLNSPSMICAFLLQDWLSIDGSLRQQDIASERINVPGHPEKSWRYRMPITAEQLLEEKNFINAVKDLIEASGRYTPFVKAKDL
ncbi:MAG: 4-alpha-glucanotransferase [Elusimicrobiota bacterium]|jgi:4-alpha-glucanotransferase|nr:4-alpha-glucanotransferase [Elusimicrobiota bacterium]